MNLNSMLLISLSLFISLSAIAGEGETKQPNSVANNHLTFAKRTNSEAWKLLQKESLLDDEKDLLLYTVFASAYHWHEAGTLVNMQRAEWLISRAYTKLNDGRSALSHANKCLSLTNNGESKGLKDYDFAYAYEAMARAYALVNDFENAEKFHQQAQSASEQITTPQDKALFLSDLKDGNWNGFTGGN